MIDVAGAAGLLRVVTDFRFLLVAVERLDGDVDVKDLGQAKCGGDAVEDWVGKPVEALSFVNAAHGEAHDVFADNAVHS